VAGCLLLGAALVVGCTGSDEGQAVVHLSMRQVDSVDELAAISDVVFAGTVAEVGGEPIRVPAVEGPEPIAYLPADVTVDHVVAARADPALALPAAGSTTRVVFSVLDPDVVGRGAGRVEVTEEFREVADVPATGTSATFFASVYDLADLGSHLGVTTFALTSASGATTFDRQLPGALAGTTRPVAAVLETVQAALEGHGTSVPQPPRP
jgi:hypothetical protein